MRIDWSHATLSVTRQADLLSLSRSSLYYEPILDPFDATLMHLIDELYTKMPFYGSRKIAETLQRMGHAVGRKRVQRLMRTMGIEAIYPKPPTPSIACIPTSCAMLSLSGPMLSGRLT